MDRKPLDELRTEPANYRGPLMMLDGLEDVPEGGPLATAEQLSRVASYLYLDRGRWHGFARRIELTEAEAEAILRAASDATWLWGDLSHYERCIVPVF